MALARAGIDVLVNNAGVNPIFSRYRAHRPGRPQQIDVNLTGVFLCCKHIGGAMGQGASIINVSSVAGSVAAFGAHCAAEGRGGDADTLARGLGEARCG